MRSRIAKAVALAVSVTALVSFAACGDDESGDGTSGSEIDISVPGDETTGTEKGKAKLDPQEVKVPRPSAAEQQQIRECVGQAQGDPDKIVDCTKIASE